MEPLDDLLAKVDNQIRQEHRYRQSEIDLQSADLSFFNERSGRIGELESLFEGKVGEHIASFKTDADEYSKDRLLQAEKHKANNEAIIKRRQSLRRRQRSAVEELHRHYNFKKPNPGEVRCLTQARGHQFDEIYGASGGNITSSAAFSDGNRLNLRTLSNGNVGGTRTDWLHFIWDGPEDPGVTTVSATILLSGSLLLIVPPPSLFEVVLSRHQLDAFVRVSQERDGGTPIFFPEQTFPLIPFTQSPGGETFFRSLTSEETLAFNPDLPIPILAGLRVVVTVGLRWGFALHGNNPISDLDFETGPRELEFPFVLIKHES